MKLKEGVQYKLRNGLITPPLEFEKNNGTNYKFVAKVQEKEYNTPTHCSWLGNGVFVHKDIEHPLDIIEESK